MKKTAPKKAEAMPEAFDMNHRFRNLANPLKFIENESILSLERNYNIQKEDLKR
jgi:hypothetical protein